MLIIFYFFIVLIIFSNHIFLAKRAMSGENISMNTVISTKKVKNILFMYDGFLTMNFKFQQK